MKISVDETPVPSVFGVVDADAALSAAALQ
jgi:hypothetical protein